MVKCLLREKTMRCYNHAGATAVGICKSCQKAVCITCVIDTGRGIACSEECETEVEELNQIVDRSKQIYGIGTTKQVLPTHVIMFAIFGILFLVFGMINVFYAENPDYFSAVMGAGFLFLALFSWLRNRKARINC